MLKAIKINPKDNVAVVPQNVEAGQTVQVVETSEVFTATEFIKAGHKMALSDFQKDDTVIKYGIPIGKMKLDAPKGSWIHCHNVEDITAQLCSGYCEQYRKRPAEQCGQAAGVQEAEKKPSRTILAYPRSHGEFGISNYLMVFPTFLGANPMAEAVAKRTGCVWMVCDKRQLEQDRISEFTKLVITGNAKNPNIYAAMLLGRAEEREMNLSLVAEIEKTGKQVRYIEIQPGLCQKTLEELVRIVQLWQQEIGALKREPVSMAGFTMAIHCGGSDWTTALSGNPTLGVASDLIVEQGGYVIMDEWGGLPGSEHILANSAVSKQVGLELLDKVQATRDRFLQHTGQPVEASNPIPANKEGGITTLVEKSTGNIEKAGSSPLQGILKVGARPTTPGVYVQDEPCNGPSATAVYAAMAGCHLNVFVTGVGFIYFEVPHMLSVRMTGNPETFQNEAYKLDFDAGIVIQGTPLQEAGRQLFEYLIAVAEGREVPKSEKEKLNTFCFYYYDISDEEIPYQTVDNYVEEMKKMEMERKQ